MPRLTIPVVQAFVDAGRGGNPAGVVLNADAFDPATRQRIATRVSLSETAFVSASIVADFKLEFFTPVRQIAQCGHATIATFSYLAQQGMLKEGHNSMETVDGVRGIRLEDNQAFMEQRAPTFTPPDQVIADLSTQQILDSLRLSATDLIDGQVPVVVNTGNSFMIVPLRSAGAVRNVAPDLDAIERISEQLDLVGYYVFSPDVQQSGRDAGARMFAPRYGISEEAATGMAAGPLACYLFRYIQSPKTTFLVEQGHLMPSPSPSVLTAQLYLDQHTITSLWVGGRAATSHSIDIDY
ncbi:PhzF family phenazine biosynthesis protein [Spirosoma sp. BT702]|uniref:PhzF family phenazine biosynthesis protein n=1 Tax=Spirosoma profusum TaxID=2771354 RepID=A0A926XZA5_9BACT|nr:PhzF family phenazine biosynthesis protein [Spirosoma profusum]MBD2703075.1 PhzF family phenazine biosynthesis protein [Spirosoma profusum]